jgi:transposase-like protein
MFDAALSRQQQQVIDALSDGASSTEAAALAGVHRNTIANWRRKSLFFREPLADAQYNRALLFRDKTEHRLDLALEASTASSEGGGAV